MNKRYLLLILVLCASVLFAQNAKKKTGAAPKKEKAAEVKKEAAPAPSPESIAKGKDVIKKTIEALGGKAVLNIKDIVQASSMIVNTQQGEMQIEATTTIVFPDRMTQTMTTPYGDVKTVFDGTKGWLGGPNGVQELPEAQTNEIKNQMGGNTYTFLQHYEQPEYAIHYLSEEQSGEQSFHVVSVVHKPSNLTLKLYIDTQSNFIVKRAGQRSRGAEKIDVEDIYSDYRAVDGVQIPFKIVSSAGGNKVADVTMNSVKINTGVKDEVFKKPAE